MSTKPNPETCGDPLAKRFEDWLVAERNVSEHTRSGYMADLAQLASFLWGVDAQPPFAWSSVRDGDARRYLAALSKDGVGAATVLRKLAELRGMAPDELEAALDANAVRFVEALA